MGKYTVSTDLWKYLRVLFLRLFPVRNVTRTQVRQILSSYVASDI
jgi:hypothetical protein